MFSFFRNADRSYRLDGTFTIGGIDNQNCDTKWNYVPPSKLYGYVDSAIEVRYVKLIAASFATSCNDAKHSLAGSRMASTVIPSIIMRT